MTKYNFDSMVACLPSNYSILIEGFGGLGSCYEILCDGVSIICSYDFAQFLIEVDKINTQSIPRHALSDN